MFAIGVRYLMGWAMASNGEDKHGAEWPPHPDRLFMALTAACFQSELGESASAALRWLESNPAPDLAHSPVFTRREVTHYVPVNDTKGPKQIRDGSPSAAQIKAGLALLPDHRSRQPRSFPVAIPQRSDVYFIWPDADPGPLRPALAQLCANVTALGHSASLVQAWLEDMPPAANLTPTAGFPETRLRVPRPGRLDALVQAYNEDAIDHWLTLNQQWVSAKGKAKKLAKAARDEAFPDGEPQSMRPGNAAVHGYRSVVALSDSAELHPSVFDHRLLILRRQDGKRLGLESTLLLTDVVRKAILSRSPMTRSEWLSGHLADGRPSRKPHIALLPLPHVGKDNADGHLLGLALAIPRDIPDAELHTHLGWLAQVTEDGGIEPTKIYHGKLFEWTLVLEQGDQIQQALKPETWTKPSRHWATVTPMVFDRHPKGAHRDEQAAALIASACRHIGLPAPNSVTISEQSVFAGAPQARGYPSMPRKTDGGRRYQRHVTLCFDAEVLGPVLIGAGRYRGYGLCRPFTPGTDYS